MTRLITCGAGALALVLVGGNLVAARSGVDAFTFPVSFVITSAGCSELPSGTTITGSGTETSINPPANANGQFGNSTLAHGVATDQDGNTYVWEYANSFRAVLADGPVISGDMTDHFSLTGNGPAHLVNGFHAAFTIDLGTGTFSADPQHSFGDPIDFTNGAAHCDPL